MAANHAVPHDLVTACWVISTAAGIASLHTGSMQYFHVMVLFGAVLAALTLLEPIGDV